VGAASVLHHLDTILVVEVASILCRHDGTRTGHNVRHSQFTTTEISAAAATLTTRIQGQSENEHEGYCNNEDGTVAFLRLPALMLLRGGGGSAVECRVFHDDTVDDEC